MELHIHKVPFPEALPHVERCAFFSIEKPQPDHLSVDEGSTISGVLKARVAMRASCIRIGSWLCITYNQMVREYFNM
jgi:hypothetical protein